MNTTTEILLLPRTVYDGSETIDFSDIIDNYKVGGLIQRGRIPGSAANRSIPHVGIATLFRITRINKDGLWAVLTKGE